MPNDYKRFYGLTSVPSVRTMAPYADPVRTDEERRAKASRIAKQQAALRRAKTGERWLVFTVASTMAIAMLPVVVVVATITLGQPGRRARSGRVECLCELLHLAVVLSQLIDSPVKERHLGGDCENRPIECERENEKHTGRGSRDRCNP